MIHLKWVSKKKKKYRKKKRQFSFTIYKNMKRIRKIFYTDHCSLQMPLVRHESRKKMKQENVKTYLHRTDFRVQVSKIPSPFPFCPIYLCTCLLLFCLPLASCPHLCPSLYPHLVSCWCLCLASCHCPCLASCRHLCPPLVSCRCLCLTVFSALSPSPGSSICRLLSHPEIFHFSVLQAAPLMTAPPCDDIYRMQRPLSPLSPWQQANVERVR